jgi:hypothetical protein
MKKARVLIPGLAPPPKQELNPEFIEKNRIVERYLLGQLPPRAVAEFERFCRENPKLLDSIGLADRLNAGLRLLDTAGRAEPWQEKSRPVWQRPQIFAGLLLAVVALGGSTLYLYSRSSGLETERDALQQRVIERPINAAASTRTIAVNPNRTGPVARAMFTIGAGARSEFVQMKINVSWSASSLFHVEIDRRRQGRIARLSRVARNSNGEVIIALNSGALGPGDYSVTLEALYWRGNARPAAWAAFAVAAQDQKLTVSRP